MSFLDDVFNQKANIMDIDKYIEDWHNGKAGQNVSLCEYLGFTEEEYACFLKLENTTEKEMIDNVILAREFIERIRKAKND